MLFKIVNKRFRTKLIFVSLIIYMILAMSGISMAENYEWTVINSMDSVETNTIAEDSITENVNKIEKDELNLDCESAILIEQTTRSNIIRKKST